MSNNSLIFEIRATSKGFEVVEQKAGKAARQISGASQATENLTKASDHYQKGAKGVAGATSNSTKAFSKMRDSMSGSSGLVSAYAVLASNLFAATAAFGALQRAAQVDTIIEGLQFLGNAAGRDLGMLSNKLVEVTNGAISMEQAMRATAMATTAGFSSEQLERLAGVAKGASIALGRDLGDALDRLVRGTAKLEPEILDELGIMVRLDDATRKYADSLGLAPEALNNFQKRQAFLNATLEQGEQKYYDLSKAVDPNPYDQLASSLSNLGKEVLGWLNNTLGIIDVVKAAADNVGVLAVAATALGKSFIRQLLPGLLLTGLRMREAADAAVKTSAAELKLAAVGGTLSAATNEVIKKLQQGELSAENFRDAIQKFEATNAQAIITQSSLQGKLDKTIADLNRLKQSGITTGEAFDRLTNKIAQQTGTLQRHTVAMDQDKVSLQELIATQRAAVGASSQHSLAMAVTTAGSLNLIQAFRNLKTGILDYIASLRLANGSSTATLSIWQILKVSGKGLTTTLKAISAASLGLLNVIGLLWTLWSLFGDSISKFFLSTSIGQKAKELWETMFPKSEVLESTQEIIDSFQQLSDVQSQFETSSAQGGQALANSYIAYSGVLGQLIEKIRQAASEARALNMAQFDTELQVLDLEVADADKRRGEVISAFYRDQANDIERINERIRVAEANRQHFLEKGNAIEVRNAEQTIQAQTRLRDNLLAMRLRTMQRDIQLTEEEQEAKDRHADLTQRRSEALVLAENNAAKQVAQGFVDSLKIQEEVARRSGNTSPFNLARIQGDINTIEELIAKVGTDGFGAQQLLIELELLRSQPAEIAMVFEELQENVAAFGGELNKVNQQAKGPFDNLINSAEALVSSSEILEANLQAAMASEDDKAIKEAQLALEEFKNSLSTLRIPDEFKEDISKFPEFLKNQQTQIIQLQGSIKALETLSRQVSSVTKNIAGGEVQNALLQNQIIDKRIELINNELELRGALVEGGIDEFKTTEDGKKLLEEIKTLTASIVSSEEIRRITLEAQLKLREQELRIQQQQVQLEETRLQTALSIQNALQGRGFGLTPFQQAEAEIRAAEAKVTAAELQHDLAKSRVDMESELLKGQLRLLNEQLIAQGVQGIDIDAIMADLEKASNAQLEGSRIAMQQARAELEGAFASLRYSSLPQIEGFYADLRNATDMTIQQLSLRLEDFKNTATEVFEVAALAAKAFGDSIANIDENISKIGGSFANVALGISSAVSSFQSSGTLTQDQIAERERLLAQRSSEDKALSGAQNALLDAESSGDVMQQGRLQGAISDSIASISTIDESINKIDQKGKLGAVADGIMAIGAAFSAIGQMALASAEQQIAAIDQAIAAEQKRDGKSKESVDRIRAMENKKDQIARKAFEKNKKMQMAATVANTSAAIMGIMARETSTMGVGAMILAGIIAAMGALQLATIASTSYQGGGSSIADSGATSISMGERKSTIDMARSTSAAGEIAYMRGERGSGSIENFQRPAFMGAKYRASGGTTGYVVGEQGPELFIPSVPGTIVPNEEMQMQPVSNVNFSIHAIDATGVQEVLQGQRGNIIGMIREAANAQGKGFFESINISEYTPGGSRRA